MLLLREQDFAASGHDSFDANSLVMVTLRKATRSMDHRENNWSARGSLCHLYFLGFLFPWNRSRGDVHYSLRQVGLEQLICYGGAMQRTYSKPNKEWQGFRPVAHNLH